MGKTCGIYVCVFGTGAVKVGRGARAEDRVTSHRSAAKCFGVTMLTSSIYACGDIANAERELIEWCLDNSTEVISREWFHGIDVGECQAKAAEIASRHAIRPEATTSRVFDAIAEKFSVAKDVTRERAAYVEARQMVLETRCLTEHSFCSMDLLHELCEDVRKHIAYSGAKAPSWFDELNCMGSWEVDLMFSDGVPDEALVEDMNRAFEAIKRGFSVGASS